MTRTDATRLAAQHGAEAAQLLMAACARPASLEPSRWTEAVLHAAMDEAMIAAHWAHVAERERKTS